jgi:hypothetical protein
MKEVKKAEAGKKSGAAAPAPAVPNIMGWFR